MRRAAALVFALIAATAFASPSAQSLAPSSSKAPALSAGIWIDRSEIRSLPTRGAAWNGLNHEAGLDCGTPDLGNQDDSTNVCVMAKALTFARTRSALYGNAVRTALRSIVEAPVYRGRALSLGRELGRLRDRGGPGRSEEPGS